MHTVIKIAVVSLIALFAIVGVVSISKAGGISMFFDNGKLALTAPIHCGYTNHFLNPFMELQIHLPSPLDALSNNSRGLIVYNGNAWIRV